MKNGLTIKYSDVAAFLANEDDDTQSEFFKIFASELRSTCKTAYHSGMQMASVYQKLSEEDRDTLWMKAE